MKKLFLSLIFALSTVFAFAQSVSCDQALEFIQDNPKTVVMNMQNNHSLCMFGFEIILADTLKYPTDCHDPELNFYVVLDSLCSNDFTQSI